MSVSALSVSAVQKSCPEQAVVWSCTPQAVCWVATKHSDGSTWGNPAGKLRPWCLRGAVTALSLFGLSSGYQGAHPTLFQGGKWHVPKGSSTTIGHLLCFRNNERVKRPGINFRGTGIENKLPRGTRNEPLNVVVDAAINNARERWIWIIWKKSTKTSSWLWE